MSSMFDFDSRSSSRRRRSRAQKRSFGFAMVEGLENRQLLSTAPTSTMLVVSAPSIAIGGSVTLTATIAAEGGGVINAGTVTFNDGATPLGTVAVANNAAVLPNQVLGLGTHQLTATYAGAGGFRDSQTGVNAAGTVRTVAGTGTQGDGVAGQQATATDLHYPSDVAFDAAGNMYIADNNNNVVRKVTADGVATIVAGTGVAGFGGDGGQATAAQLNDPYSIAVDSAGNLFIGDSSNYRIRKVTPQGIISTVAGTGTNGFSDEDVTATSANINAEHMTVDAAGNLYFTDYQHDVVRKVTPGGVISTVAGNGTAGYSGDGGQATAAEIRSPHGIAVDAAGNIYFDENDNNVIRMVTPGGIISTIAGIQAVPAGYTGDGGPATAAHLNGPYGLALDAEGNLFFADSNNHVIRKIAVDGTISTVAGTGTQGTDPFSGEGGPANRAAINFIEDMEFAPDGSFYYTDSSNNVVRTIAGSVPVVVTSAPTTTTLTTSTATTTAGQPVTLTATVVAPNTSLTPDGGTVTFLDGSTVLGTAPLVNGTAMLTTSTLPTGRRFVTATYGGNAQLLDSTSAAATPNSLLGRVAGDGTQGFGGDGGPATAALLKGPRNTAIDAAGNIYIADEVNFRVREITPGGIISTVAGDGTDAYTGDGGLATSASLGSIVGIAVDSAGNLYLADVEHHVIRKVATDGIITTIAGDGTRGYNGDGGPATSAMLDSPTGLVIDAAGNLYIATGPVIRKVTPGGVISTYAGSGTSGNSGDGGPATSAHLTSIYSMAMDAAGNLYLGDVGASVIRKVANNGIISTIVGDGVRDGSGSYGDGGLATHARIADPFGLAVDGAGNLYFHDGVSLHVVTPDGIVHRLDDSGSGSLPDGGPVSGASVSDLVGLTVDPSGNLYLSVYNNSAIYRVATSWVAVDVVAAPARFVITGITSPATAGVAQTFTVTAVDDGNNPVTAYTGTVHFTSTDPNATLPADVALVNGVGTFGVTLRTAGTTSVTATDVGDGTLLGSEAGIQVVAAAATHYGFAATTEGQPIGSRLVTVTAYDPFGNVAAGYNAVANVSSPDPGYNLPATVTFAGGVASFSTPSGTLGTPTVTVTDAENPALTGTLTGQSTPATATHFVVAVSTPSVAGSAGTVTVTAFDDQGNVVAGYDGPVAFSSTDGRAVLPIGATLVNGVGTFPLTFRTAGPQSLTATAPSNPSLSGTTPVLVAAGQAFRFAVTVASGGVAGGPTTVTVTAFDAFGNVATGYAGSVRFAGSDPTAIPPAIASLAGGVGTFAATLGLAPTQAFTATDVASPALSGTSAAVPVAGMAQGVVFLDPNANGVLDPGETGLAGRSLFLDLNGNGVLDAGEPTTITNSSGAYGFLGIARGTAPVLEATDLDASMRHVVDQSRALGDGSVDVGVVPFSPVAPVPVVPNPFAGTPSPDASTAYVRSLYLAVLGRQGSDVEVASWVAGLARGMGREDVASAFVASPEHRQQQVASFYQTYLHRGVDPYSQYWVDQLLAGASEEQVSEGILDSPEYQDSHKDDANFVRDLYLDVLGREVEDVGMGQTGSALAARQAREAVVTNVVTSDEAIDQILDGFYSSYLRRGRDGGSAMWKAMLGAKGGSASAVAAGILASDEFYGMATRGNG